MFKDGRMKLLMEGNTGRGETLSHDGWDLDERLGKEITKNTNAIKDYFRVSLRMN